MQKLPHRLREETFRQYEAAIYEIVERFPAVVPIRVPDNRSPATIAARLRDAILSLEQNHWQTKVDVKKFNEIRPKLEVSHRGTEIYAGGHDELRAFDVASPLNLLSAQLAAPIRFKIERYQDVIVLARLAALRALNAPIQIEGIDDDQARYVEENFDVCITKNNDNTFTLL